MSERIPYHITFRDPKDHGDGAAHEIVFTPSYGPNQSTATVVALTSDELRDLYAAAYARLRFTVPGSQPSAPEWAHEDGTPVYRRTGTPPSQEHEHAYGGQKLRHSHPGGGAFHGYFEHPEDCAPQ